MPRYDSESYTSSAFEVDATLKDFDHTAFLITGLLSLLVLYNCLRSAPKTPDTAHIAA